MFFIFSFPSFLCIYMFILVIRWHQYHHIIQQSSIKVGMENKKEQNSNERRAFLASSCHFLFGRYVWVCMLSQVVLIFLMEVFLYFFSLLSVQFCFVKKLSVADDAISSIYFYYYFSFSKILLKFLYSFFYCFVSFWGKCDHFTAKWWEQWNELTQRNVCVFFFLF